MLRTGLDVFLEGEFKKYRNLRLGILCNQASVDNKLVHICKRLTNPKLKLNIQCFFGPQHGIRGEKQDNMIESRDFIDSQTGLKVFSLYGEYREPTQKMFEDVDAIIADLQDIGTRIYTFIYTLANTMRAAKKYNKKVIVLDRPNPIGGKVVEGNILNPDFSSFVGEFSIPTRHGMTIGELSVLFNEYFGIGCDLKVIPLKGWKRNMFATEWKRPWIPPSPNIPCFESALLFPGAVHFEGTNVSEGRGTTRPFETIGAPFIEPEIISEKMNNYRLDGVFFRPVFFEPTYNKHMGKLCGGVFIHVLNPRKCEPFKIGLYLLDTIAKLYKKDFMWKNPPYEYEFNRMPIDLIAGTDELRKRIDSGESIKEFFKNTQKDMLEFNKIRKKYLLYS